MNIKPTLTIGICAYRSEKIIGPLLESLIRQKNTDYKLQKILVHCDLSGDQTFKVTKKWRGQNGYQNLVEVIQPKIKLGFGGSFCQIIKKSNSDITVVLNDDIKISQKNFINQIAQAFSHNKKLGLTAVHLKQLPPRTFVEKAVNISIKAYEKARLSVKQGNNIYSCDGKVLALSKQFCQKIVWPKNRGILGNVDAYLYLSCISKNLEFKYLDQALVSHRNPSTLKEYLSWTSRNNSNYYLLQKTFGDLAKKEFHLPKIQLWQKKIEQFFKYPFECLFLFGTSIYIRTQSKKQSLNFNPKWESLPTTKEVN